MMDLIVRVNMDNIDVDTDQLTLTIEQWTMQSLFLSILLAMMAAVLGILQIGLTLDQVSKLHFPQHLRNYTYGR